MSRLSILISAGFLLLTFILFTIPQYAASVRASDGLTRSWQAADYWMMSAECARKTGVVLAVCRDGRVVPIAEISQGDDPGHALALGIYSAITRNAISPSAISVLNSIVNYAGIVLLAVLVLCLQLPLMSFLILTLGTGVADEFHALAPHPAQLGAACFAAILPIVILGFPIVPVRRTSLLIWIAVGLLGLSVATLFRQSIGLMGVVAALGAVATHLAISQPQTRRAFIAWPILIAAIFVSYQTPVLVILARNAVYHLPPAGFPEQHGIWHNVYIGLGAVPNPFGIAWDDVNAWMAVERIDPSASYASAKHFTILRDEYFRILTQHPIEVANIYRKKLHIVLDTRLPAGLEGWHFWEAWLFLCIVGAFARRLLFYRRPGLHAADAVLAVAIVFTVFFIDQGTLIHFSLQYLFPVHLFLLLWAGTIAEYLRLSFIGPAARQRYAPGPIQQSVGE